MSTNAPAAARLSPRRRKLIISASLLALFLGALDALVMSAAMPTVVAELGGLDLFSWVYSAYLLTRTVALPLFGKLADIYRAKTLYVISILIFIAASLAAGFAPGMTFLIFCRALQGLGAGGTFALVYIVLTEISAPEERGKTLSLGSFVWGLASVLGPTLGGFIVAYFSWRWIFFINVPLGILSLAGVARHLVELRRKREGAKIDIAGAAALTATVLCLLFVFLLGGQAYAWLSPPILALAAAALGFGVLFAWAETRARDPVLPIGFFRRRGFSAGNAAVFLSSFAIFAFFGFAPLFIQGALGKSPVEVGTTVLALSLGWSIGSLILGRLMNRIGARRSSIAGALILAAGCALTLSFSTATQARNRHRGARQRGHLGPGGGDRLAPVCAQPGRHHRRGDLRGNFHGASRTRNRGGGGRRAGRHDTPRHDRTPAGTRGQPLPPRYPGPDPGRRPAPIPAGRRGGGHRRFRGHRHRGHHLPGGVRAAAPGGDPPAEMKRWRGHPIRPGRRRTGDRH